MRGLLAVLTVASQTTWGSVLASASIGGRVADAVSDLPIAHARVAVLEPASRFTHVVTTDRDGRYVVSGLPPGEYRVVAPRSSPRS
jgi:hypothetical protein